MSNYPLSDDKMFYDYDKHRYILTEKCVLDELNVDLAYRLKTKGNAYSENYASTVLDQISLQVYNFIYQHNSQWLYVQMLLAKAPSARQVIKEAMKQQVLYFLMNGALDKYSGVDIRKGSAMSLDSIRNASIDPQAVTMLQQPLVETGLSLLYCGRYSTLFFAPKYQEEQY